MEPRTCNPFELPDNVLVPAPSKDVLLSRSDHRKRARMTEVDQSYPFNRSLPESTGDSCMRVGWVPPLPIDDSKADIVDAVKSSDITFVLSETSSGKTSRVPQFILDDH